MANNKEKKNFNSSYRKKRKQKQSYDRSFQDANKQEETLDETQSQENEMQLENNFQKEQDAKTSEQPQQNAIFIQNAPEEIKVDAQIVDTKNQEENQENLEKAVNNPKASKKTILKNFFYNAIYQVFLIIVPLITTPYVSRVLLPSGVGQYSFSLSIITYFTIIAVLGSNLYGQREMSKYQNDKHKQSIIFWEVTIIRFISSMLCLAVNLALCGFNLYGAYNELMLILSINIFSVIFDFSFVLMGNEQFGKLAIRNFITKTLSVVSIFLFVKTQNDVWIYTLIHSLTIFISNIILLPYLFKNIKKVKWKELNIKKQIWPIFKFFLPTIIISIYSDLDKTLVGIILMDDKQNGYYEQADKIIKIVTTLITALSTVMISRNSEEIQKGNKKQFQENIYFSSKIVWFLGLPLMFGTIAISKNMNLWFFGEGYSEVINLMIAFAPIVLIIGLSNITGIQYLVPMDKENDLTKTIIIGALTNIALSIGMIYLMGTIGAIISSVISEAIVFLSQLIIVRKDISVKKFMLCGWKNWIASIVMFVALWFIQLNMASTILNTILLILLGGFIYFVMIVILRDDSIKTVKNKLLKKRKSKVI